MGLACVARMLNLQFRKLFFVWSPNSNRSKQAGSNITGDVRDSRRTWNILHQLFPEILTNFDFAIQWLMCNPVSPYIFCSHCVYCIMLFTLYILFISYLYFNIPLCSHCMFIFDCPLCSFFLRWSYLGIFKSSLHFQFIEIFYLVLPSE